MRKTLRQRSGQALRIFGWVVKGGLLVIAPAALVMWPVSRGQRMGVSFLKYSAAPDGGVESWYLVGCWDGRLVMRRDWTHYAGTKASSWLREEILAEGDAWRRIFWSNAEEWDEGYWPSRWGPFRWHMQDGDDMGNDHIHRHVAAPLWLVALVTGVWPAVSLAGFVVRRRRRRKAAREGLCEGCGYDLRATPERCVAPFKPGELLAVCPECGNSQARSTKPESRKE